MKQIAPRIFVDNNSLPHFPQLITSLISSCFVLVDDNTLTNCYTQLEKYLPQHTVIQISPGEERKTLQTCELIWKKLTELNADRNSMLINLGGGVICDIGGFAAGCYKRGIKFINVPTTLLAMVDASVGGKTGIDFMGYKNQIGLFNEPEAVFIHSGFLQSLSPRELASGFAEVLKHYLIADKAAFDKVWLERVPLSHFPFEHAIEKGIGIKLSFVAKDPNEQNVRKALNFGHTIGHAVESHFLSDEKAKLLHGEAVAVGMIAESFISAKKKLLNEQELKLITDLILHYFKLPRLTEKDTEHILALIKQDKKNVKDQNQFTLLQGIGNYSINNKVEQELIIASLNYYNSQLE